MLVKSEVSGRSVSGARIKTRRKKRLFEIAGQPSLPKVGKFSLKKERVRNGCIKLRVSQSDKVNLYDSDSKKYVVSKVLGFDDNPANRNYVRRGVFTKGAVINTDKGKAVITNRPGQEGCINAILVKK